MISKYHYTITPNMVWLGHVVVLMIYYDCKWLKAKWNHIAINPVLNHYVWWRLDPGRRDRTPQTPWRNTAAEHAPHGGARPYRGQPGPNGTYCLIYHVAGVPTETLHQPVGYELPRNHFKSAQIMLCALEPCILHLEWFKLIRNHSNYQYINMYHETQSYL